MMWGIKDIWLTLVYFLLQVTTAAASGGPQLTHLTKERAQVPKRRPPRKFKPMDEDDVCIVFTIVIVCCVICICVFMFMCVLLYVVCIGIHNILLKAFLPVCMKCKAQEYNGKCSRRGIKFVASTINFIQTKHLSVVLNFIPTNSLLQNDFSINELLCGSITVQL